MLENRVIFGPPDVARFLSLIMTVLNVQLLHAGKCKTTSRSDSNSEFARVFGLPRLARGMVRQNHSGRRNEMYLTKLWYLKNIDLLRCMEEVHQEKLLHFASLTTIKAGEDIYFPEQGSNHVYLIHTGHVRISKLTEEGEPALLDVLSPGEIFGKLVPGGKDIPNEFAEAADDVTVCIIARSSFQSCLDRLPDLHFHLTRQVEGRIEEFEERVSDLVFKDATRRIINFLVRYARRFGKNERGLLEIEAPLTLHEISTLTATSPQTVAAVVKQLQEDHLLELSVYSFIIHDLAGLQELTR